MKEAFVSGSVRAVQQQVQSSQDALICIVLGSPVLTVWSGICLCLAGLINDNNFLLEFGCGC